MEFIDLGRQYDLMKENIDHRIRQVIDSKHFIMGEEIFELEEKLANFVGRKYCLTCGSGTEALQIPLMALDLNKSDAIFVPTFTFFASAESISLAGATPIFIDVDETYNISVDSLNKEISRIKEEGILNPKGIVVVDLFGRSADYDRIIQIAEKNGLFVIEDAAQGFGGSLNGKRNGGFGIVSATSFFPAKPLGCYGDGGAIFTDDLDMYNKMKSIRVHGAGKNRYDNIRIGINGRMDTIQAAVLLAKLEYFEDELDARQNVANWYTEELYDCFGLPIRDENHYSAWAQYTVRAKDNEQRQRIISGMKKNDIPVMVYYSIPIHEQVAYKNRDIQNGDLSFSVDLSNKVFSLPMHPYLKYEEVKYICKVLKSIE